MNTSIKLLHWTPRILCILAILFISLFALDSFGPEHTIWQQIGAFLIHLIPSFVLTALLVIAWKWELVGGIIFTAIGVLFTPFIFNHNYQMNNSVWLTIGIILSITFPFVLVGVLFILSYYRKRKEAFNKTLSTN